MPRPFEFMELLSMYTSCWSDFSLKDCAHNICATCHASYSKLYPDPARIWHGRGRTPISFSIEKEKMKCVEAALFLTAALSLVYGETQVYEVHSDGKVRLEALSHLYVHGGFILWHIFLLFVHRVSLTLARR